MRIQVLERAHRILSHLSKHEDRLVSLGELARVAEIRPQACANIVRTLVELGYISSTGKREGYRLGPMIYYLAKGKRYREDLVLLATPIMDRLVETMQEFCVLVVNHANKRVPIVIRQPDREIQVNPNQEVMQDPRYTSTGRVLLAYLAPRERQEFVRFHPFPWEMWPEIKNETDFEQISEQIRKERFYLRRGTSTNFDESVTFAFPILRDGKYLEAVLGVKIPAHRWTEERHQICVTLCWEAVKALEEGIKSQSFS